MRRLSINHSEPAKKIDIPKNRCRTTIAEADSGNASGTALYRGSGRLLKPRPGRPQRTCGTRSVARLRRRFCVAAATRDREDAMADLTHRDTMHCNTRYRASAGSNRYFLVLWWCEHAPRIVLPLHLLQAFEISTPIGGAMVVQAGIGEILVTPLARERLVECGMHFALPLQAVINILVCISFVPVKVGIRKTFRSTVHEAVASRAGVFIAPPVRKNVIRAADVVPGQVPNVVNSV